MNSRFRKFPLGCVKVGGEIGRRMEATATKILDHLDIEGKFARHFKQRLAEPLAPGGFVGYGMLLDAIVKAVASGAGGDRMRQLKDTLIAELAQTQTDDGAISIFQDKLGVWDNHEQAYIIIALAHDHALHGAQRSLETAVRLGNYLLRQKTSANIAVEQALLMLYEFTGDKRFLAYCLDDLKLAHDMDTFDRLLTVNGTCHVYSYIARVGAQLELGRLTGDYTDTLLAGARELYRRILTAGCASITGSCTGGRNWGEIWDASQIGLGRWGETCATAYLLRNCATMLELEGDSVHGDLYERAMYNALFAAQSPDGLSQRYFVPFNEPGVWYENETYCCPNNLRRIMFELPLAVAMRSGDGLVVNLYEEFSLRAELDGATVELSQKTTYPDAETAALQITTSTPVEFTLRLRVPRWCQGFRAVVGEETFRGAPGEFLAIRQTWAGSNEVKITLPAEVRLIKGHGAQEGKVAMMRGPVVYGVDPALNKLVGHDMDLLSFKSSSPPTLKEGGIARRCVAKIRAGLEREVLFTRFSSPGRAVTYLADADAGAGSEDELLKPGRPYYA